MSQTDWEQMPYFLAVARAGSLRGAAVAIGTTHLKVNRHLQALEAAYGTDLVRRGRRGITLTEAGQQLLPVAEEAELMFLQARRGLQGLDKEESGDLRFSVSGPLAYCLVAPIMAQFSKAYPGINLILHVSTLFDDPALFQTDVSLRMIYEVNEDAVVRKLFPIAVGNFAHREYIRDALPQAGPLGEGLVWIGPPAATKPDWVRDSPFPNAEVRHNVDDPILHRELAAAGLGMTRIGAFMARERPELELLPGTELDAGPPLTVIIHPELRGTVRVRRFVDFLIDALKRRKSDIQ